MDDFFEELDSELGDKKLNPKKTEKPKSSPTRQTSSKKVPNKSSAPSSNAKLTLKKSPAVTKGKLRLKQERVSTPKVSTASTRAGVGKPNTRGKKVRTISAPSQLPLMKDKIALPPLEKGSSRFVPIGGLRTVGANMNMLQYGDEILLVDGGLEFSKHTNAPGCDSIIPDVRFLAPIQKKIKGMFITHGHLDHIGGLKHMIPALGYPPIYAAPFTIAMIKKIFTEIGILGKCKLIPINPDAGKIATLGNFKYEFFRVNHTIPDSCGVYLETPTVRIMHMGDYKIDFSPRLDKPTDLPNLSRIANRGIDILLQETTNSQRNQWTTTEAVISGQLRTLIAEAKDRIIIGNFSTLISRIQDVVQIAEDLGKYVFISGRSMVDHVAIAREMGYLKCKRDTIKTLDPKTLQGVPTQRQLIITTGAQGEYYGGLGLMSRGDHRVISIKPRDTIILSSSVIPGNELAIGGMVNDLHRFGPKIITIKEQEVHSGGHGGIIEQKVIMSLVKPKCIIPVHGDLTKRLTLKKEAIGMGFDPKQLLILEDGAIIDINTKRQVINTRKKLRLEALVVDGQGIGLMGSNAIKDRMRMGEEGMLIVTFPTSGSTKYNIESRGLFFADEVREAHKQVLEKARKIWSDMSKPSGPDDESNVKKKLRIDLQKYIMQKWDREPMVVPVIV